MKSSRNGDIPEKRLITFALFAYNQERYIVDAVEGALSQTYSPLEILISDDCSTDRTFALIEAAVNDYHGPHQIKLTRNQIHLGLIEHVNQIFQRSSSDLIVAAAGDDISLANRVECLFDAYQRGLHKAMLIHSCAIRINDANEELGVFFPPVADRSMAIEDLALAESVYIGATALWNRSLFRVFGPIGFVDAYEDLVLGFRAALTDGLIYIDKPLVRYRVNVGISSRPKRSIVNIPARIAFRKRKLKMLLDVFEQRLKDVDLVGDTHAGSALRIRLIKKITVVEKRICFYQNPVAVVQDVFSKNPVPAFKAITTELAFLMGVSG